MYETKGLQDMKHDVLFSVYVLSLILYKMMMMNMMFCSCTMYDDDVYLPILWCFGSNACSANELLNL